MVWDWLNDNSGALEALSALISAVAALAVVFLTVGLLRISRRLSEIEERRTTADFRLEWAELHPLSAYSPGPRDLMIYVTNAGGHASAIAFATIVLDPRSAHESYIPTDLAQPDGSGFSSLNIQPGERLKVRLKFTVAPGQRLTDSQRIEVQVRPVLGPTAVLRHHYSADARAVRVG